VNTLLCKACQKEFEYNPKEYGGICNESEYQGSLCRVCWDGLMELKRKQYQEVTEWFNSRKAGK